MGSNPRTLIDRIVYEAYQDDITIMESHYDRKKEDEINSTGVIEMIFLFYFLIKLFCFFSKSSVNNLYKPNNQNMGNRMREEIK